MAIAVWTNSNVAPNNAVTMTSLSVVGYTANDSVESTSITKTPTTSNVLVLSPQSTQNSNVSIVSFTANDAVESTSITKTPLTTNVLVVNPQTIQNSPALVTKFNANDAIESASITKTPFGISVPFAWSGTITGGYSGQDIVVTEYADEYWFTN